MADLTDKQSRFVEEYLVDLNATQAAIRAGYSENTAHSIGHENLSKPEIADAIAQAQQERSERTKVTQDMVIRELARIGFSDLRKLMSDDGVLKQPSDWDDETAAAISSMEVVRRGPNWTKDKDKEDEEPEYTHKIKTWDKNSALEKLAKHLGMFVDKVEHSGAVTQVHRIERRIVKADANTSD